jgi:HSP20 family protein
MSNNNNNNNNNMNQGNNFWDFVASMQNYPGNTAAAATFPFGENRAGREGEEEAATQFDPFQCYQQFWASPWQQQQQQQQQHGGGRRGHAHRGPHPPPGAEEGNNGTGTPRGGPHEHHHHHGPPPPAHHRGHGHGRQGVRHEHEHDRASPAQPSVEEALPSRSPTPPTPPETPAEPHHHPHSHSGRPRGPPPPRHHHHHGPPPHHHRTNNRRGGRHGSHGVHHPNNNNNNNHNPFNLTALAEAFAPALFASNLFSSPHPFTSTSSNNTTHTSKSKGGNEDDTFIPNIDLHATPTNYTIYASLAGAKKPDMSITYSRVRHSITISGVITHPFSTTTTTTTTNSNNNKDDKREQEQQKQGYYITNERPEVGWFEREVLLEAGVQVDEEGIVAKLEDGVLRVVVPKIVVLEDEEEEDGWESVRKVELE